MKVMPNGETFYNTYDVAKLLGHKHHHDLYRKAHIKKWSHIYAPDKVIAGKTFYSQAQVDKIREYEQVSDNKNAN